MRFLRTPLDLPLILFLVSSFIGYWASYDPSTSAIKLGLIAVAILAYYALVLTRRSELIRDFLLWSFLALEVGIALYFATQNDFTQQPSKFGFLTSIGLALNHHAPQFGFHQPHPNIVAGVLEIGLPFALALAWHLLRQRQILGFAAAAIASLIIGGGLALTASRGAFLAIGLVVLFAVVLFVSYQITRAAHISHRLTLPLSLLFISILLLLAARLVNIPALINSAGSLSIGNTSLSRLELYKQTGQLIQDYYFTGGGLGLFPMLFSSYALFIDVPFLNHAHNLYLEIWLEQGVIGFIAFLWLIAEYYAWNWSNRFRLNWLSYGGLAATSILLLHGLTDAPLYVSRALPLLFVPLGFSIASLPVPKRQSKKTCSTFTHPSNVTVAVGLGLTAVILTLAFLTWNQTFGAWEANLGSVEQSQLELGSQHQSGELVSAIRREKDLTNAESSFRQSLAVAPSNPVANRRLGLIQLARMNFGEAINLLEASYQSDPDSQVTRKALGYAYTWNGDLDKAALLLGSIREAENEMGTYSFWWKTQGHPELAKRAAAMSARLQDLQ